MRYRIGQVERLTGKSLASTQDRAHLWLALLAIQAPPPPGAAGEAPYASFA